MRESRTGVRGPVLEVCGIRPFDDCLRVRHPVRLNKLSVAAWQPETNATVGRRAKSKMATSKNAVPLFREEDRMGPSSIVPLLQIQKLEVFADLELLCTDCIVRT
jgi:hypothetical protein